MGFMNSIQSMLGQQGQGSTAQVAGGFLQELEQHPGGVQSVLSSLQQNGLGQHVNNWSSGQTQAATPEQVQQGLGSTGLIDKTAQRLGVSTQTVQMAMTTVLPMVVAHFAPGGQAQPQSNFGGLAQQMLGKLL